MLIIAFLLVFILKAIPLIDRIHEGKVPYGFLAATAELVIIPDVLASVY